MNEILSTLLRSGMVRTVAIAAAVVATAATLTTTVLDKITRGDLPAVAIIDPDGSIRVLGDPSRIASQRLDGVKVDMNAVGSIDKSKIDRLRIDPCTGRTN